MFKELEDINNKPKVFEFYTTQDLWNDEYTSKQMMKFHLNQDVDAASRNHSFIDKSVAWIIDEFKISNQSSIADFGCGPGLYTSRLAKTGAAVTGIDFSRNSLQYARDVAQKNNININYVNQNYLDFKTKDKFDLIIMIMCDFCVLSPNQRKQILTKFYNLLKSGGAVLLDVYSLCAFARREEQSIYEINLLNGFWSPNKYYGFLNVFKYEQEKVILDKYTIVEEGKIKNIYNWLQYFDFNGLKREFESYGFEVTAKYGDVAGSSFVENAEEFAIVALK
ncbi:MAG: class I SAM-dependent methyltransferase [Alphaproteobacteria bacterium]